MNPFVQKLAFSSTQTLQDKAQKQINDSMYRNYHPKNGKRFVPRVCCNPRTVGTYLADKEGVLCKDISGISSKVT